MNGTVKNAAFHERLALLIGTEEPFKWAKRMGIPSATFARIWNNHDIPKHEHLCRIALNCHVSLDWLLLGKEDDSVFAVMPLTGLACCGVAQGWYNETELSSRIVLPAFMAKDDAFAVIARGSSMVPAGISDGNVCVVYPNRPCEIGKPALIRTKTFVKGREVSLAAIKLFESEDETSVGLTGWLEPDESGTQSAFHEKRLKSCITMMAPVGNIVPAELSGDSLSADSAIDRDILKAGLETLRPVYAESDSEKFADMVIMLCDHIKKSGKTDLDTISKLIKMLGK